MASLPQVAPFAPTRVGRYVLFEEFARGGMASVHFARLNGPAGFSRVVAVKRVRAAFLESEEHRRAILTEARIASRIRHPNVIQTLDVVMDEGVAHVVMEYVHGATASELLQEAKVRGERAPVGVAVAMVADALQGLQAAHEARDARGAELGIVHRDVSPQNVHVGVDGLARILDFGIAKAIGRTQVTEPGVVKGKIAYMSREQLSGAPVTRQADVYAMGVVLWELLTGERLWGDDDPARVMARLLSEAIAPPSARAPGIPAPLDQVVLRATAHDPRQRYESAAEMLAALTLAAPRADAHEVGAWVERLASDSLELRAESVHRAESAALDGADARAAGPHRSWAVAASVAAGVFALVFAGLLAARPRALERSSAAAPFPPPASGDVTPAPPPAVVSAPSAPAADDPAPIADEAPSPSPTAFPSPTPSDATPARVRAVKHRAARGSCDPPFSVEASGRKHYKPECLR